MCGKEQKQTTPYTHRLAKRVQYTHGGTETGGKGWPQPHTVNAFGREPKCPTISTREQLEHSIESDLRETCTTIQLYGN
ncbi:unnamed protein product [Dicrocoelium dendriticum]|nr:unnamed protein product [Dicrocoelium dendriticum]